MGTRPEAIKLVPLIRELETNKKSFISVVCSTAQHRQMLDQALLPFRITLDHDLNIMTPGQTLAQITAKAVDRLDAVLAAEKPDLVLVQGDTTTAFCGALAAFYHKVRVGHVEAGLRTDDKYAPFPEEINRRLVTQLADLHFAPTALAKRKLQKEGVALRSIFVTGNTVIDALLFIREKIRKRVPPLPVGVKSALKKRKMVLVTGHRRESFGGGFENICQAIREVADNFNDVVFVYPVHLNPNVREPVGRILGGHERIILLEPLGYEPFVWLMDNSSIILTDSGGVQEEAPSLGKPVLVMRETTERPEGIAAGNAKLVGTKKEKIVRELSDLLLNPQLCREMMRKSNPYGDGKAAFRIVKILSRFF